jgi:energy-coupling factor transporter ATP-binding protein EcfA2
MLVRLAFSVMIQVDADILLIDEVLAVGDAAFQQKCFDEFNRLRAERRTILFVTHDMASVQRFCDRAMLLDRGRMQSIGGAEEIAGEYFQLNFGGGAPAVAAEAGRRGDGSAEVLEGWFEDENGERADTLAQGRPCAYCARVRFNAPLADPTLAVAIVGDQQRPVFATSTVWQSERTGTFAAGEEALLRVAFENALAPGRYHANTSVARAGGGENVLDRREHLASVLVTGTRPGGGLVDLPHDFVVERMRERV